MNYLLQPLTNVTLAYSCPSFRRHVGHHVRPVWHRLSGQCKYGNVTMPCCHACICCCKVVQATALPFTTLPSLLWSKISLCCIFTSANVEGVWSLFSSCHFNLFYPHLARSLPESLSGLKRLPKFHKPQKCKGESSLMFARESNGATSVLCLLFASMIFQSNDDLQTARSVLAEEAIKILKASTLGWIESATLQRFQSRNQSKPCLEQ